MAVQVEILVDIPNDKIEQKKQEFKEVGFEVVVQQQASGLWSLAAAKCD